MVVGLGGNILFFRVIFKKKTKNRANTYTWLCNMGIMLVFNFLLVFAIVRDIDTGSFGGAIGLPLFMMFYFTPMLAVGGPSLWALIRAIQIKIKSSQKRKIKNKTSELPSD